MAAQDLRTLVPRVRRALEGPITASSPVSDPQVLAMTADAIADLILFTAGEWDHVLVVTGVDEGYGAPNEWAVDPELQSNEESVVAVQAALTYFFHAFRDQKVSERIRDESREWEWSISASLLRDQITALRAQRDQAVDALIALNPVFARYASILAVRDRLGAAVLEPWLGAGIGGITASP